VNVIKSCSSFHYFNYYLGVELDGKYYTIGSPNEDGIVQIKPGVGKTGIYIV
jgi:hypothetical protein